MNSGVHCDDDCIVPHSVEQGRQEADPVEARYASIKTVKNYNGENNTMPHAYIPSHVSGTVDVEGADDINEHEGEEPRHKHRRTGETDGRMDQEGEEGDNEEEDEQEEQERQEKGRGHHSTHTSVATKCVLASGLMAREKAVTAYLSTQLSGEETMTQLYHGLSRGK